MWFIMGVWTCGLFVDQKRPDYSRLGDSITSTSSLLWRLNRAPFDPAGVAMRRL